MLLAWENEAWLARAEFGPTNSRSSIPRSASGAEPPVALVDTVVDRKGTRQLAQAYLDFLYTKEGQEIAAKDYYRPRDQEVAGRYAERYPPVPMFGIEMVTDGSRSVRLTRRSGFEAKDARQLRGR